MKYFIYNTDWSYSIETESNDNGEEMIIESDKIGKTKNHWVIGWTLKGLKIYYTKTHELTNVDIINQVYIEQLK